MREEERLPCVLRASQLPVTFLHITLFKITLFLIWETWAQRCEIIFLRSENYLNDRTGISRYFHFLDEIESQKSLIFGLEYVAWVDAGCDSQPVHPRLSYSKSRSSLHCLGKR